LYFAKRTVGKLAINLLSISTTPIMGIKTLNALEIKEEPLPKEQTDVWVYM
jgi:hypothetical protein